MPAFQLSVWRNAICMVVVVIIPHLRVRTPGEHEFWCPFFCKHSSFHQRRFRLKISLNFISFDLTIPYFRLAHFTVFFFSFCCYYSFSLNNFLFLLLVFYYLFYLFAASLVLPFCCLGFCFLTLTFCTILPIAKGRTNLELREQFILPEGASQGMTPFKPRASPNSSVSSQPGTGQMVVSPLHARSPSLPTAGPITKVRLLPIATNSNGLLLLNYFVLLVNLKSKKNWMAQTVLKQTKTKLSLVLRRHSNFLTCKQYYVTSPNISRLHVFILECR